MTRSALIGKAALTLLAIGLTVCAVIFGFKERDVAMGSALAAAVLFLAVANADRLAEISFGPAGVRAKTRNLEIAVRDLQNALCALAGATLAGITGAGRTGGVRSKRQREHAEKLIEALRALDVSSPALDEVLEDVRKYTVFDYSFHILEAISNRHAPAINKAIMDLGRIGPDNPPSPETLESLCVRFDLLNDEFRGLLDDYRYYLHHHAHRRPEVWDERRNWLQLVYGR